MQLDNASLDEMGTDDGKKNEKWKWNPKKVKFLIQGVYNVLPSPSNLFTWGKVETHACPLCSKTGTLEHILSSCSKALGEGLYCWRHDQVLKTIAEAISMGISISRYVHATARTVTFIKEREQQKKGTKERSGGFLSMARD